MDKLKILHLRLCGYVLYKTSKVVRYVAMYILYRLRRHGFISGTTKRVYGRHVYGELCVQTAVFEDCVVALKARVYLDDMAARHSCERFSV